ncbi:MAG: hypothetical protein QGI88_10450, partial [SAR202 cluster bacterium]|nr:hypothetical protein [SAR202 cluster bacterium]
AKVRRIWSLDTPYCLSNHKCFFFYGVPLWQETLGTTYRVNDRNGTSDSCVWAALRQARGERMGAWLTMGGCSASRGVSGATFLVNDHNAQSTDGLGL